MKETVQYLKIGEQCDVVTHVLGGMLVSHNIIRPKMHVFYLPSHGLQKSGTPIGESGYWQVRETEDEINGSLGLKF